MKDFILIVSGILVLIVVSMGVLPPYRVWQLGLHGEAELRQAEWNRQVVIKEANAKFEASKSLALAEVERAKGVAEANKIIGTSLHENEDYLRYLWIVDVANNPTGKTIVYIPTEANLPILESLRFGLK